jgi:hypothetical protein
MTTNATNHYARTLLEEGVDMFDRTKEQPEALAEWIKDVEALLATSVPAPKFKIGQYVTYADAGAIQIRLQVIETGQIQNVHGVCREICLVQKLDTTPDMRVEKFIFSDELKPLKQ